MEYVPYTYSTYLSFFVFVPELLPPEYQLSLSLLPWQQVFAPAVMALSLHLLPLQLCSTTWKQLDFLALLSFLYLSGHLCLFPNFHCEYTDFLCGSTLAKKWLCEFRPFFFLLLTYSELFSSMLVCLKEERIIILNIVLPHFHGRISMN